MLTRAGLVTLFKFVVRFGYRGKTTVLVRFRVTCLPKNLFLAITPLFEENRDIAILTRNSCLLSRSESNEGSYDPDDLNLDLQNAHAYNFSL